MSAQSVATEPAVFELACVLNNVKHVVICGHSDCKAVNLLYDLHTDPNAVNPTEFSPLRSWVHTHGARSMNEFFRIEQAHFRKPLLLNKLNKKTKFPAYVDVDEKFSITDKLSMVNTLVQMENVTSYPFMRSHKNGRIHIHAFWFDIYTGDIHCYSRKEQTFVIVSEDTLPKLQVRLSLSLLVIFICLFQAELDELISQTAGPASTAGLNTPDGPETLSKLMSEVRRNFSTGCPTGCSHH